jgi:hypothetical protein
VVNVVSRSTVPGMLEPTITSGRQPSKLSWDACRVSRNHCWSK